MEYKAHQSVKAYFEALMQYDLKESDVNSFVRKGDIMIINTSKKTYFKTIHNETSKPEETDYKYC